ncbi:MAG: ABC transporter substrate-binding protein [Chloroflexi bacterium]|nr:ABC transporter substrate-binding protein [Chloroflexota bacterium]
MRRATLVFLILLLVVPAGACDFLAPKQPLKLKVGILPIVDVLPMHVAEAEGYYQEQQLEVELVLFLSAIERDAALQAGQIDGQLNDLVSVALLNRESEAVQVVRLTYQGSPSRAMMVLLAAPNSEIRTPQDLKGKEVAVSGNTVIEYATDRLLQTAGLSPNDVKKTEVSKIPVRAEMLAKGQIAAGTLPEPLASLTVQQGARVILDDSQTGIGQSVLSFRAGVVEQRPEAIRRFLTAYEKAVVSINAAPEKYRDLLVDRAKVPPQVATTFAVPQYPQASVPSKADVAAVNEWALAKGMIGRALPYERIVNPSLLPKR